jgi:hypothetical protein
MGSSVPWSDGRPERLAYRDVLAHAAAAVSTSPPRVLRGRIKLRPDIGLRPQRTIRRSHTRTASRGSYR